MTHPYLRLRFRLRAMVTLVDAMLGAATLDNHPEAVKQAAMADRIVLTKTDLVADGGDSTGPLRARLRMLNPSAPILDARAGEATAEALVAGVTYDPATRGGDVVAWLDAEAFAESQDHRGQDHDGHDHHAHHRDVNRHDARIRAFALRYPHPVPPMAVAVVHRTARLRPRIEIVALQGFDCPCRRSRSTPGGSWRATCDAPADTARRMAGRRSRDAHGLHPQRSRSSVCRSPLVRGRRRAPDRSGGSRHARRQPAVALPWRPLGVSEAWDGLPSAHSREFAP